MRVGVTCGDGVAPRAPDTASQIEPPGETRRLHPPTAARASLDAMEAIAILGRSCYADRDHIGFVGCAFACWVWPRGFPSRAGSGLPDKLSCSLTGN